MHMSDALVSTPVALTGAAVAVGLLAVAGREVKKQDNTAMVPLMGVLGAFVFAAQMINFAIPGTGSSGHVIGGVLLAAFLGPWAATRRCSASGKRRARCSRTATWRRWRAMSLRV